MATFTKGIKLKKHLGQHFLRDQSVVDNMLSNVELTNTTSVFEIGCGDGFLTAEILRAKIARLWVFEIDHEWAEFVTKTYPNKRMTMFEKNFLDVDFKMFEEHKPWTVLSNLPYQVTFPILTRLQQNRHLIKEGVVMVQEEVADKILKKGGRGYGYISLFFQHYFDWKQLVKVPPAAFVPPPKVNSRLLYFKPRKEVEKIVDEENFWKFIKVAFKQPRRTFRNNIQQTHYDFSKIKPEILNLRAQQLSMKDLLEIWNSLQQTS